MINVSAFNDNNDEYDMTENVSLKTEFSPLESELEENFNNINNSSNETD
jgi:hypothetical protein